MQVWFNPKCSKCRMATEALDAAGAGYELRRYLDDPPTAAELRQTLTALGLEPWEITRMSEPRAAELLLTDEPHDRDAWIDLLCANPELIQRPIVVTDDGSAWIARDSDSVDAVLSHLEHPPGGGAGH